MNGKQHYLLGEATLVEAEHATDHVASYRLAATAQAHFQAAIAAWFHSDRESLSHPPVKPPPASVGLPMGPN